MAQASRAQGSPAAELGARSNGGGVRGAASASPLSGQQGEPVAGPGTARTSPFLQASHQAPLPLHRSQDGQGWERRGQKRRIPHLGTRVLGASLLTTDPRAQTVLLRATWMLSFQGGSHPGPLVLRLASAPGRAYLRGGVPPGRHRHWQGQGLEHQVVHDDLVHLCTLQQQHLHHVCRERGQSSRTARPHRAPETRVSEQTICQNRCRASQATELPAQGSKPPQVWGHLRHGTSMCKVCVL